MMTVKVGIVRCGDTANSEHMSGLQKVGNAEMIAFCDIDTSETASMTKAYRTDNAKVYDDYKVLLKDDTIDAIHVYVPDDSRCEITVAGLYAGKHVMYEKPMAKTTVEAQKMIDTAKSTDKRLTIGYQNRFQAGSQSLHQAAQRGDLGDTCFEKTHATRRRAVPAQGVFLDEEARDGEPLVGIDIHALDLTLWMTDNYGPGSVMDSTFHKLDKQYHAANAWGLWDPDEFTVEDSASGFIKMKNRATIILESTWATSSLEVDETKCPLSRTKAGVDIKDGLHTRGGDMGTLYTKHVKLENRGVDFYEGDGVDEAEEEVKAWVDAIINDTKSVVKPEQAMIVIKILGAIYQSVKSGKITYFE